ncbi:MAG: hypothetical protein CMF62_08605 [Magnetococcales bacterium]|nr:hypothetical protein [Magnetococcales bacterium]
MKLSNLFKVLTVCVVVGGGLAYNASASSLLFISPHRAVIASGDRTTEVTVANQSDYKRRYEITLIDSVMTEAGATKRVDTFEYSAKRMLRYVPRSVELEPGERQTVRVMVRRPRDLADGDYHTHMLFREQQVEEPVEQNTDEDRTFSFEVGARYGVAIPVIVQAGTVESDLSFGTVTPQAEPKGMTVEFKRGGNAEANGFLRIFKETPAGEEVASSPMWVRIYREVDRIERTVPLLPEITAKGTFVLRLYVSPEPGAEVITEEKITL